MCFWVGVGSLGLAGGIGAWGAFGEGAIVGTDGAFAEGGTLLGELESAENAVASQQQFVSVLEEALEGEGGASANPLLNDTIGLQKGVLANLEGELSRILYILSN